MAKKHLMIAVHWYGPFGDLDEAREAARDDFDHGLYMVIGKKRYERKNNLQYIGIGTQIHTRLNDRHHKLTGIVRDQAIWLGEVVTSEPSGRKLKVTRPTLDYAEWLHVRFLNLPSNEKKKSSDPNIGATVLNRWWHTDYERMRRNRPHPDWPDLIDFAGPGRRARMVWFGGKQRLVDTGEN